MLVIFTTAPNSDAAHALAAKIVGSRLAACVQVLPKMTSYYPWNGAIQNEAEHLLLIKTLDETFDALERFLKENHSYEIPEIVAIKAEKLSEEYAAWMRDWLT